MGIKLKKTFLYNMFNINNDDKELMQKAKALFTFNNNLAQKGV